MTATKDKKSKALENAISQVDKQYGKGSIMHLDPDAPITFSKSISTGCLSLDVALGIGGVPRGRVIEIYGPESSGKTTLALQIVAEAQKTGGYAAFIDAEHAMDPEYAEKLESERKPFILRDFLDGFNKAGNIPVELIRQEMIGN